jgi:hypothetical protein
MAGSCNIGDFTFSNFSTPVLSNTTLNTPNITTFDQVVNGVLEVGLVLNYTEATTATSSADVFWTFNVSTTAGLLDDMFAAVGSAGSTNGAVVTLAETVVDANTRAAEAQINIVQKGNFSDQVNLATPTMAIAVSKDQGDFAVSAADPTPGQSFSGTLTDAFSETPIPGTIWLFAGGLGLLGLMRKRRAPSSMLAS